MTVLNEKLDDVYLNIQCSKRVLASDYRYNFRNNSTELNSLFADVNEKKLLHTLKPLHSPQETFAPYVEKKRGLSTTPATQGTLPTNTQVTTAATTPPEAMDNVPNFLTKGGKYFSYWKPEEHKMKIDDDEFFFNVKKYPNCISRYVITDNCPFLWSPVSINMCTFGSTIDSKGTGPYWKYNNDHTKHLMPKLLESCRHENTATEQGYTLLHDTGFLKFAKDMHDLLWFFILKYTSQTQNTQLRAKFKLAKNKIPDYLRIGDTCFTSFDIVGGINGRATWHSTGDDLFQIFYVSSQVTSGGDILINNNEDNMGRSTLITGTDGIVVCGEFNELFQEHKEWVGKRYTLYFSTSRKIFDFFMDREPAIWKCYAEHDYPMCRRGKAPVIQYTKSTKNAKLTWQQVLPQSKKNIAPKEGSRGSGYCDIFLPKSEKHQTMSWLRCCLEDVVLNAAIQLNIPLDKQQLYKELPPQLTTDLDMFQLMTAPCVSKIMNIHRIHLDQKKGGTAYNLLQLIGQGVYICLCNVKDFVNGEFKTESHAFVYNSDYEHKDFQWCKGAIIDNRTKAPMRLIKPSDQKVSNLIINCLILSFMLHVCSNLSTWLKVNILFDAPYKLTLHT